MKKAENLRTYVPALNTIVTFAERLDVLNLTSRLVLQVLLRPIFLSNEFVAEVEVKL